jgi:Helix-turn-helix.
LLSCNFGAIIALQGSDTMIIGERIKEIRKINNLTQADFAKKIGVGQAALSALEKGIRNVTDRNVSQICYIFNINDDWLRTGIGKMSIETSGSTIDQLVSEYNLDNLDKQLLSTYLELSPANRQALKTFLTSFSAKAVMADAIENPIDQELANYKQELEAEQRAQLVCEDSDLKKNGTK